MTPTTTAAPPAVWPELAGTRRFTVDEYHRLIDADILGTEDKVELIEGYILLKQDHVVPPAADGPFPAWRWLRRFSTGEYHRMIDLGILGTDERLELLDGYLVLKMPQNPPHRAAANRLKTRLEHRLPAGWVVFLHCPIPLSDWEPEADGVVVRGVDTDYDHRAPAPADFGIVIEASDSTLATDRRAKREVYARAGLPTDWIVNLVDRQVEVYTDPDPAATPPAYRTRADYRPGQDVPVVLDGAAIAQIPAADLLP